MKIGELNAAAGSMIDRLKHERADNTAGEAKKLIETLREARQFDLLVDTAATYNANAAYDPDIAIFEAQGLIELGKDGDARKLLADTAANVAAGSQQFVETKGLLGRAWKQTFFESADKSSHQAMEAINNSLTEYKASFDAEPGGNAFAGVNLLALSALAKHEDIPTTVDIEPRPFALKLLTALDATPVNQRDNWYHASRAEAYLGLGDLDAVEMHIGAYVRSDTTTAFDLGSTLRQFTELWHLDQQGERGHGIVQALRTALLIKENGRLELSSDQVLQSAQAERPSDYQLQKILGAGGEAAYDWWLKGIVTAQSVGVISHVALGKQGTGFLVRGGDLIPALGDELIVMTNAHVICDPPAGLAIAFGDATITFEAVDKNRSHQFAKVLWQSGVDSHDCSLLRLQEPPANIKPLEIAKTIPPIPKLASATRPRVYVIGYPGGKQLTFSFEDNYLLDHEAPPDGTPPNPNVCRVQYRAPTEEGSSGSPVFESSLWRVIALHHAGDKEKMPMLNGKAGTWPANEGIWIQSIVKAVAADNVQV
jgi:V8-like Glu-specific endopeptidase